MTQQEHMKRHKELHRALDELLADFFRHADGGLSGNIEQLMGWSYQQTRELDHSMEQAKEEG